MEQGTVDYEKLPRKKRGGLCQSLIETYKNFKAQKYPSHIPVFHRS